jgi:Helix-turn-helix domain
MSWNATAWAKQVTAGGPGPKAVLLCLADRADEEQSCYPSQQLLATETEQSVRTVQRQLADLEERGLIRRVHRARSDGSGRSSDRYFLLVEAVLGDEVSPDNLSRKDSLTRQGRSVLHDTGVVGTINEPSVKDSLVPDAPGPASVDEHFEEFWATYPTGRKDAKKAVRAKYATAVKNGAKPEVILAGLQARVRFWCQEQTALNYIPQALTWVGQARWEDEIVGLREKREPVNSVAITERPAPVPTW